MAIPYKYVPSKRRKTLRPPKHTINEILCFISQTDRAQRDESLMLLTLWVILAAISRHPSRRYLVVKGGTLLRLLHGQSIGRVSKDLDLSLYARDPKKFQPEVMTGPIITSARHILSDLVSDPTSITIELTLRPEAARHGNTQLYRFRLFAAAAGMRVDNAHFRIELSVDEAVIEDHLMGLIVNPLHGMGLQLPIRVQAYDPIQALAEKLRAILQKHAHFDHNGNTANWEPRHVTDLLLLMEHVPALGGLDDLAAVFAAKCAAKREMLPPELSTRARMLPEPLQKIVLTKPNGPAAWVLLERLARIVLP